MARTPTNPTGTHAARRQETLAILAVACAVMLWGFSAVAIKSVSTSGMVTAFYRLWFAIPLLWTTSLAVRELRPTLSRKWLMGSLAGGSVFALHQLFFFSSVKMTTIANVTIIGSLQPVLVLLLAAPLFGEHTSRRSIAMSLVALGGTGLVVFGSTGEQPAEAMGDLLAVGNLFAFTAYLLISKQVRGSVAATEYVVGMTTVAGVVMFAACLANGEDLASPSRAELVIFAMLAIFPGTIGHVLTNWAHAHTSALSVSMILLASPVVATGGAALFLDESVTPLQALGFAVVLGSIATVVLGTDRKTGEELAESAAATDAP